MRAIAQRLLWRPPRRTLSPIITLGLAALLAAAAFALWLPSTPTSNPGNLRYPAESAARMVDRHLQFYAGIESEPTWKRRWFTLLFGTRAHVQEDAEQVYRDVLTYLDAHPERATPWALLNTRARLIVLLAELDQWPALERELAHFGELPEEAVIVDAVRFAYGPASEASLTPHVMTGLRFLPVGWAADHARIRVAERRGQAGTAARIRSRLISRGQTLRDRTLLFTGLVASLAGLALVALAAWWRQGRPALRGTARALDTPWPPGEGFGVLVRAGALGLAILAAASLFPSTLFKGNIVALWSTLFASLPMLWLIHRHLLKPRGLTFSSAFGLTLRRPGGVAGLLGVTVVVIALDQAGALAISWSAWQLGFQPHWWEGLQERWIWGPWDTTLLAGVNAVVWGPVFEEIGFRGLVYVSLRSRLRPVPAALISAGLFSLLHLYSLSGFLVVLWSGLIWAFVFERVRSLLPGMIAHAGGNMLALSTALLFYR